MLPCAVEFRKYVEKDAALERRFQPVHVHEPSAEHALTILEVWLQQRCYCLTIFAAFAKSPLNALHPASKLVDNRAGVVQM